MHTAARECEVEAIKPKGLTVNDVPAVGKEHLGYVLDVDVEAHARRRYRSLPSPDQRTSRNRIADDGDPSPLGLLATRPLSTAPSSIMADVVTHSPSVIILHLGACRSTFAWSRFVRPSHSLLDASRSE